ncbi:MAG TPA: 5'-nucleotidase C-terminal domain-containing protein [Actinomycetota bacterium]|jgi:5'-nucleotidase|nr:5'-nucleotidase C-terminal domain-containing protein [Actinomycetota bacterium]
MRMTALSRRFAVVVTGLLLAATAVVLAPTDQGAAAPQPAKAKVAFWLTIAHNNDGESQLIDAGSGLEDYGGIARFANVVKGIEDEALARRNGGFIMVSSGDNYLAGPEFNASLEKGVPFYDSIALNRIGYDAMAIGNHEFDFGPDVFARFVKGFDQDVPFVSANLNVKDEPKLNRLAKKDRIVKYVVVEEQGHLIGIVGATTPNLPFITSPRNVKVRSNVAGIVQKQVNKLEGMGVDIIILVSHLQSIDEDLALAPMVSGIDVMIAGGGDELLADPDKGDLLVPGDEEIVYGSYPLFGTDGDGHQIPVVTTSGDYRYVGKLVVGFDADGDLVKVNMRASGPVRVTSLVNPDGVKRAGYIQRHVVVPVEQAIADAAANVVATSEVDLNGLRDPGVRTQETNEGDLIADALLTRAAALAPAFGAPTPDIALQNGGGIRNNNVIPAGDVSELQAFSMVPFANFVTIVPDISPTQLKEILENAVSRVEFVDGRFAQIAGFTMVYDAAGTGQVLDEDGTVTTPGTRVVDVTLDDGTPIIDGGAVVAGAPSVDIATIDFLARGGDQYPYRGAPFVSLGVTYFQALMDYLTDDLGGAITAADYPEGGEGRITRLH